MSFKAYNREQARSHYQKVRYVLFEGKNKKMGDEFAKGSKEIMGTRLEIR